MKVIAKKNLYLDKTSKVLFTKNKIYTVKPTSNYYMDHNIKDDHGYIHTVTNQFINNNFEIKGD